MVGISYKILPSESKKATTGDIKAVGTTFERAATRVGKGTAPEQKPGVSDDEQNP